MKNTARPERRLALLAVGIGLLASGTAPDERADAGMAVARTALEEWVETRRLISEEKRAWTLGKEILQDQIALREDQIAGLVELIGSSKENLAEVDAEEAELSRKLAEMQGASAALEQTVAELEQRARELLQWLPEPVREHVRLVARRLPEDSTKTELSLSDRFLTVAGILTEVDKANRELSIAAEIRQLADGTSAEVSTLYVGLGQAYYTGLKDTVAGVGVPSADGWVWTEANEHAADIARAIAIQEGDAPAAFVRLPVRVE